MKNSLIVFKEPAFNVDIEFLNFITDIFFSKNIVFNRVHIVSNDDVVEFKNILEDSKIKDDNLFLIEPSNLSFDIKKTISQVFHTTFVINDNAKLILEELNKKTNSNYSIDNAVIPINAMMIANCESEYQGYALENEKFTLIKLPQDEKAIKGMIDDFITKYFEMKFDLKREVFSAKFFGDKDKLLFTLNEIKSKYPFVSYLVKSKYNDHLVELSFDGNISKRDYDEVVRFFVSKLFDGIYAEFDTSLSSRLFDLLKLRNVRLSTAESFTAGRIVSSIIENSGASNFVYEGIVCYNSNSKRDRLNVREEDLNTVGAVSSKVAYQMALDLLKSGNCDISISTTGYAGPETDEFNNQLGLYYIGVGMKDGVDVYKYRGSGSREEITERAKNTALFLAIKKLKKI